MFSAQTWADLLVRLRYPLFVLGLALVLVCALGAQRLVFENDYKVFFTDDDPHLVAHEAMEDAYTKSDSISFLIGVEEGDLFTPQRLQAIADLTERMWTFQRVIRVDSVTNFQHTEAQGDDLTVYALFENPQALSAAEIARRKAVALNEVTLVNAVIAADGRATVVNARLEMPTGSSLERGEATASIMADARALRDDFVAEVGPLSDGPAPITLAHNVADRAAVDTVLAEMVAAGGTLVGAPQEREWGGYTGYAADPDGYRWEIAWNPGPIGQAVLP